MASRIRWVLALTLAAWLLVIAPANAYIDAGTTGFIFSALVAFFAAAGMLIKSFWSRVVGIFRRDSGSPSPDNAVEHATDEA